MVEREQELILRGNLKVMDSTKIYMKGDTPWDLPWHPAKVPILTTRELLRSIMYKQ